MKLTKKLTKKVEYLTNTFKPIARDIIGTGNFDIFVVYDITDCVSSINKNIECYNIQYICNYVNDPICAKKSYVISKNSKSNISTTIKVALRGLKYNKLDNTYDGSMDISLLSYANREKVSDLRKEKNRFNINDLIYELNKEYSSKFKVGNLILYKGSKGIIDSKIAETYYRIKIKDDYFEVDGMYLKLREKEDLSHITIDPTLNKISTKGLLKMLKRNRKHNGSLNERGMSIKRILSEREHVKKG